MCTFHLSVFRRTVVLKLGIGVEISASRADSASAKPGVLALSILVRSRLRCVYESINQPINQSSVGPVGSKVRNK
jgi:hypothetical protein